MSRRTNPGPQRISAALRSSPEWRAWEQEAYKYGWDWAETNETGWMSDEHFAAFMDFVRLTVRTTRKETCDVINVTKAVLGQSKSEEAEQ